MNNEILQKLFSLKDIGYKEFNSSLIPSVNKDTVIGVRIPLLKGSRKNDLQSLPEKLLGIKN